ncbi:hypothetical protein [Geomonas anaerohicana]|uniref:General secretion pathway protein B n=1 Tax=Geomonas anaerohicana TaxID=2798583 RepID=A0ABS0YBL4_9BACT|nr:hypothetical protein [Geomonas anaerohicana]MBJ6749710.1 hypothetical protein [Geomonas anaerohicana]
MSSILKALEKVDESQRSRRPAGTGGLPKARGRRPAWMIPVCTLGGAAIATLATYALMGGFSHRPAQVAVQGADTVTAAPVAAAPAKAAPAVRVEAKEVVAERTAAAPAVAPVAPVKPAQPVTEPAKIAAKSAPVPAATTKQAAQPVAKPVTQAAAKAATPPQIPVKVAAKQLAQPSVAAKAPTVAQPAPVHQAVVQPAPVVAASAPAAAPVAPQKSRPEIRVSGIAWQNSSEASFAMVNGSAMRQGNVVNGYKIEQIYEDSVRFSNGKGNTLVVPLGAGEE